MVSLEKWVEYSIVEDKKLYFQLLITDLVSNFCAVFLKYKSLTSARDILKQYLLVPK